MADLKCYCPALGLESLRVKVLIRCEDLDGREPMELCFVADRSLGYSPGEVSTEILHRVATFEAFELRALGEATPFTFRSSAVRKIAVW